MLQGHETIIIIDFGSQYTQLITRRIREANVYSEIHLHSLNVTSLKNFNLKGIIFSGGPMSVYNKNAIKIDQSIYNLNVPILGICYGMNTLCMDFSGKVEHSKNREYGKTIFKIVKRGKLFKDVKDDSVVWMSHGDHITELPEGFTLNGKSDHTLICAMSNETKNIYGVQFHPEVVHSAEGKKIIDNFLFDICNCKGDWTPGNFINEQVSKIRNTVGDAKAICALSGGVDSTVAAVLVKKAIGDNLIPIHIDNGLMRKNESEEVGRVF
ncbi:MAG: glutamine-hydrolyzing GMP synthase, partial [Ignavibacteria bacterium]